MNAIVHINNAQHQATHGAAIVTGLERHGVSVEYAAYDDPKPCDVAVIWGAPVKHPAIVSSGARILVMERGHLQDRMAYTSCGWGGLGRRGRYPAANDGGARWRERWGRLMQPWKTDGSYALLIGQCPGDAALYYLTSGFSTWAQVQTDLLIARGFRVRFRPHPLAKCNGPAECPARAELSTIERLEDDLLDAALCVTFNSTAGVEAVLAGVPTITLDEGAMAWDVSGHGLFECVKPDRERWSHDLAHCQWTLEEIASGEPWARLAPLLEVETV